LYISFLGIFPVCLIIHGTGHPVRWALLIPGAVLVAAIAAWACVPLRAGIGVTPDRILIRTATGDTIAVPWAQVTGFEGGKGSSTRDPEAMVFVLTSGGERWHTAGYSAPRGSAAELCRVVAVQVDEAGAGEILAQPGDRAEGETPIARPRRCRRIAPLAKRTTGRSAAPRADPAWTK
jgi:hypothetical protein